MQTEKEFLERKLQQLSETEKTFMINAQQEREIFVNRLNELENGVQEEPYGLAILILKEYTGAMTASELKAALLERSPIQPAHFLEFMERLMLFDSHIDKPEKGLYEYRKN